MVHIFKTSVHSNQQAETISSLLDQMVLPHGKWSIDFSDCDKVLRVETNESISSTDLKNILTGNGFLCDDLPD